MPTTKAKISEQISRIYSRYVDRENIRPVANKEEMKLLVEQGLNDVLKKSIRKTNNYGGIKIPSHSLIPYTVSVQTDAEGAYVTIPAFPLDLPNSMGVWDVYDPSNPMDSYIPIPVDAIKVITGTIVEKLEQKVGFWVEGDKIRFTEDITTSSYGSVSDVKVILLVSDLSQVTDNQPLPVSSEYERAVIRMVLESLSDGRISQAELAANNDYDEVER